MTELSKKHSTLAYVGVAALVSLAVIIFFVVTQPGNRSATSDVSTIYFADNISPAHLELIARFNEAHAGKIEVVPVNLPFSKFSTNERKELLARALRSRSDRIDVFSVDLIWVQRFAKWAEPLEGVFTASDRNTMIEYALESCFHNGSLVSAPFFIDIGLMYYRADLLQRLPNYQDIEKSLQQSIDWDEFIRVSETIVRNPGQPYYMFPGKNFEGLICSFMEFLIPQGGTVFSGDSVQFDTPEARHALQLMVDLIHRFQLTPEEVVGFNDTQNYQHAIINDALFFRGWPGGLGEFEDPEQYGKLEHIRRAPLPHIAGTDPSSIFGGWNLMVSRFSSKKEAAFEFVKFVLSEENQKLLHQVGGSLPIRRNIYADSVFLERFPDLMFYRNLLDKGVHRPYTEDYTKLSDILSYYINLALKNEMTVDQALSRATHEVNSNRTVIR